MLILDSSAMIAYRKAESGGEVIGQLLSSGQQIYAHAINLCEVFYDLLREKTPDEAEQMMNALKANGIIECNDMDAAFWRDVATLIAARRAQSPRTSNPNEKPRWAMCAVWHWRGAWARISSLRIALKSSRFKTRAWRT